MEDVSEKVIKHLNEVCTEISEADNNFIQFIKNLVQVSSKEIKLAEIEIHRAISEMKYKLHEDVTDDARDYILSGKSKLGPNVKFKEVLDTIDNMYYHPDENYRELMMWFYSDYCAQLEKHYRFREWQFSTGINIVDNIPYIDFLVPEDVADILIDDLKNRGLVGRKLYDVMKEYTTKMFPQEFPNAKSIIDKFQGWIFVRFINMSQENVREIIRRNSRYVYHITDAQNIDDIKKTGLTLNNLSHPEVQPRIFLMTDNRDDAPQRYKKEFDINRYFVALIKRIHQYRLADGSTDEENPYKWKFALLTIDIDKIPKNVEFYWDIHSFPFAFFTEDFIPSSAIVNYEIRNIKPLL